MQTQEDSSSVPENIDLGAYNKFTIPNIVALYSSPFAQGYSDQQRQAAIRALLRHGAHADGAHYHTKTPNGLHPGYAAFTTVEKSVDAKTFRKRELIEASLNDLFDAVTTPSLVLRDSSQSFCFSGHHAGPLGRRNFGSPQVSWFPVTYPSDGRPDYGRCLCYPARADTERARQWGHGRACPSIL